MPGGAWNPESWNGIGVVTLVVMMGVLLFVSLQKGWLVLGIHHREILQAKDRELEARDRELAASRSRSEKDGETISTLSQAMVKQDAIGEATTHLLGSVRELVQGGGR